MILHLVFRTIINQVNSTSGTNAIEFNISPTFTLTTTSGQNLPPLLITGSVTINATSNEPIVMDGTSLVNIANHAPFRGLFIDSGNVSINHFAFQSFAVQGGKGGNGAGGG